MAYSYHHPEIFTVTSKARAQFQASFRQRIYQSQVRTPKGYQALEAVGYPPVEPDKFAHCPLESMPVNRQWYHEAIEEFFRKRTIRASSPTDFLSACSNNPDPKWIQEIRILEIDIRHQWWSSDVDPMRPTVRQDLQVPLFFDFPCMPKLRSLRVHAHASVFLESLAMTRGRGRVLGTDDFIAIPGIRDFLQALSRVRDMKIMLMPHDGHFVPDDACWARNVENLTSWMMKVVNILAQQAAERRKLEQEDVETRSKDA